MPARETETSMANVHSFSHTSHRQIFTERLLCAWDTVLSCPHGACSLVRDRDSVGSQVSAPVILC